MCISLICKSVQEYFVWTNSNFEINLAMNFGAGLYACFIASVILICTTEIGTSDYFHEGRSVHFRSRTNQT